MFFISNKLLSENRNNSRFFSSNSAITISPLQADVLVGGLLGDLFLTRAKPTHNARMGARHSTNQKEYLLHLFSIFSNLCTPTCFPKESSWFSVRTQTFYHSICFYSKSLVCLNFYWALFYPYGVKVVPACIEELLTARALAYWILDDGYRDGNAFRITTDSFCKEDVELLMKVLKKNFDIDCSLNIHKNKYYRIYICVHSINTFRALVAPYFIPSMMYKLTPLN
jgi:hypothetical protein